MPVPAPHPSVIEDTDEHSSENRELERVATRLGDTGTRDLPVTRLSGATAVVQELNQVNLYKPQQYSSESLAVQGFLNMRKSLISGAVNVVREARVTVMGRGAEVEKVHAFAD